MNVLLVSKRFGSSACLCLTKGRLIAAAAMLLLFVPVFSLYLGYQLGGNGTSAGAEQVATVINEQLDNQQQERIDGENEQQNQEKHHRYIFVGSELPVIHHEFGELIRISHQVRGIIHMVTYYFIGKRFGCNRDQKRLGGRTGMDSERSEEEQGRERRGGRLAGTTDPVFSSRLHPNLMWCVQGVTHDLL